MFPEPEHLIHRRRPRFRYVSWGGGTRWRCSGMGPTALTYPTVPQPPIFPFNVPVSPYVQNPETDVPISFPVLVSSDIRDFLTTSFFRLLHRLRLGVFRRGNYVIRSGEAGRLAPFEQEFGFEDVVVVARQDDCFFETAAVAGLVLVGLGVDWAVCVAGEGIGWDPWERMEEGLDYGWSRGLSYPVDLWGRLVLARHHLNGSLLAKERRFWEKCTLDEIGEISDR